MDSVKVIFEIFLNASSYEEKLKIQKKITDWLINNNPNHN